MLDGQARSFGLNVESQLASLEREGEVYRVIRERVCCNYDQHSTET